MQPRRGPLRRACALVVLAAAPLAAQGALAERVGACGASAVPIALPGGAADDDARARGLRAGTRWRLMRRTADSARALIGRDSAGPAVRLALVAPEVIATSQSDFPLPDNDGPLWAGRGTSWSITTGVMACSRDGRFGAIVAPTFWRAENRDIALVDDPRIVPPFKLGAHPFSSPYHFEPRSLDVPRRYGVDGTGANDPGVIAAWFRGAHVEVGITTEGEWWGPGMRNALLLSTQASGVARGYVRTARPLRLAGELDAQVFLGRLEFGRFFREPTVFVDTARSLSGAAAVWRPWFEPQLQIGMARLVAAPIASGELLSHALDFGRSVGRPNARSLGDSLELRQPDQLMSVFAHWRLPDDGTEVWLEFGRAEQPRSLTDLLASPSHTRALTIGLLHTRPVFRPGWFARVAFEYTNTTRSGSYRERPIGSWYTSRSVPGGFTQRGQVLGAMIGPGSVGQWAEAAVMAPRGSLGLFVQRIKWDDDTFYQVIPRPNGNGLCKHDVSLAWGLRGLLTSARVGQFEASLASQQRLNLNWQALGLCFANEELQVDGRNLTLSFRWRPPAGRR